MADISFGDFKTWLRSELNDMTRKIVKEELKATTKELDNLKKEHTELKKSVKKIEERFDEKTKKMEKELAEAKEERSKSKSVSNNNLKYLINHDRNRRKQNVMLFGVAENAVITLGTRTASSDAEKADLLIDFMGCADDVEKIDMFRLGKVTTDKPRPIKITFANKDMAFLVLSKAAKLKELKDLIDQNIYCKPDKSKSEQAEFQRLGKKKEELLTQYPTPVKEDGTPGAPLVILEKGTLKVDGTEVDSDGR